jgi:hypothetical protein
MPTVATDHRHPILFIIGVHRSGTSLLHDIIRDSVEVSGFRATGVPQDEGQFLQTVMPTGQQLGGVGRFGLTSTSYLDEASPLLPAARHRLFSEWKPHWDLTKPLLVEKSPPNILRTRFLQAVFPNSRFLIIVRHPISSCLGVTKWTGGRVNVDQLIKNWLICHEKLQSDLPYLRIKKAIHYEHLVTSPNACLKEIIKELNLPPDLDPAQIETTHNDRYFDKWQSGDFYIFSDKNTIKTFTKRAYNRIATKRAEWRYEKRINKLGYSFFSRCPLSSSPFSDEEGKS